MLKLGMSSARPPYTLGIEDDEKAWGWRLSISIPLSKGRMRLQLKPEIPLNMSIYDVDLRRLRRDFAREPIVFGIDMLEQRKLGVGQEIGSTIFVA
jgi:hypothetical protein